MITRVQARNYRSLGDIDVTLGRLTLLVGRNGAGKSNFVDVLRFLRDITRIGLEDSIVSRKGIAAIRRWAPTKPYDIEVSVSTESGHWNAQYSFAIGAAAAGYRVKREKCEVTRAGELHDAFEIQGGKWLKLPNRMQRRASRSEEKAPKALDPHNLALPTVALFSVGFQYVRSELRGSFYAFFPNVLREPQKPSDIRYLSDNGDNLASVLRQIQRDGTWKPDLCAALARITSALRDFRVTDIGGYLVTELQHTDLADPDRDPADHPWFEAALESDGTLRALAILAAMYQRVGGRTIQCFEEPEIALHPGALAVLRDVFEERSRRRQVLITTQSPDLISRFNAADLRVVERVQGATRIGPLDNTQVDAIQQNLFSTGDLLRIEDLRRQLEQES